MFSPSAITTYASAMIAVVHERVSGTNEVGQEDRPAPKADHGGEERSRATATCAAAATRSLIRPPSSPRRAALRAQHHHHDQVTEHDRRSPLRPRAAVGQLLDAADDEPAEHRAADVADPAHHRRGERDQAGLNPWKYQTWSDRARRRGRRRRPACRRAGRSARSCVLTLIPISRAASGSCAVARIALPGGYAR